MKSKIVEASYDDFWLKVIVARLDDSEIRRTSTLPDLPAGCSDIPLLRLMGNYPADAVWILDLSTMEGAAFSNPGGIAEADIAKREARL